MREAGPSLTAQRVAAYRLGFERQPAPFGDPGADMRLSQDVVGPGGANSDGPMARYLQARTTFFDRVLLNALERGTAQVVLVGAGYDGRALRYAKPRVDWFELDHPATQADKRERLGRLGLPAPHIHFVEADFNQGGVAEALLDCGYQPGMPSVLLCEGVAVYLDRPVLEGLLTDLRAVSAYGSRLGISFSADVDDPDRAARRRRFSESVGALGEPARTVLGSGEAAELLGAAGWAVREVSDRARRAGLLVAETAWAPGGGAGAGAAAGVPHQTKADAMMERISLRAGVDGLARHLEAAHGVGVTELARLDVGVYRVDRADGTSWVARLFPRSRPVDDVRGDAAILGLLESKGFPAERLAPSGPVTVYEGQGLLVTWFVAGATPGDGPGTYRLLGDLLGRLNTMGIDGPAARPGGAWHHLVDQGHVDEELAAALALVRGSAFRVPAGQEGLYRVLEDELASWPHFGDLPEALVHPDFVPPNMVSSPVGLVVLDWAGAGRGSRLAGLGFTLWAAGARGQGCIDALVRAYRPYVQLEPEELDRLEAAIGLRRLVLQSWAFCVGRQSLAQVVERLPAARAHSAAVAAWARPLLR